MKAYTSPLLNSLRMLGLTALVACGFSTAANAAYIAYYDAKGEQPGVAALKPFDWVDHISTPSDLTGKGGVTRSDGGGLFTYIGWNTTINQTKFVSFTISADPGYQLNLTSLSFSSVGSRSTSYQWGYRVNDGSGFGAWVLDDLTLAADSDYGSPVGSDGQIKSWDFADFSTTGTVEFGLFATATTASRGVNALADPYGIAANGTVTAAAIPEPSTYALIGVAGVALLAVRRRKTA